MDLPDVQLHDPAYHYVIKCCSRVPPLLMPESRTFFVNGIMAYLPFEGERARNNLFHLSQSFTRLCLENKINLYHQAEDFFSLLDYRIYYGEAIYEKYLSHKANLDPTSKLHSFFAA